jgi:diguanylate cyclase (GGDEF)-like protein
MTASDHPVEMRSRGASARLVAALAALRTLPGTFRASEYVTVGQSPRFRAVQRRRTRTAARAGFLVVAVAVAIDLGALLELGVGDVWVAMLLDVAVITGALAGVVLTGRSLRQWPELVAWVVMSSLVLSTVVTGLAVPTLTVQSIGYLLLLPGLVALVLPWRTSMHLRWLLAYVVLVAMYLSLDPMRRFAASERNDLLVVVVVAVGASLAGHILLKRAQVQSFAHLEHIRALRRRADTDMVELERVHHALELTARIDPLTGAGNRRRLEEDLRAVRAHVYRSRMSYGLIEIDIDHFKRVNDSLGHLAGDEVLRQVVQALQGTLRATDANYRFGGEEFLVILPVTSDEALRAAAERLRAEVEALSIPHPDLDPGGVITVSVGATLIGTSSLPFSDDQWFGLTDAALYDAKAAGRNQVRIRSGLPV